MINKDEEILNIYKELDGVVCGCIPEDDSALKVECGAWIVEIALKNRKIYTIRRAFDEAASGRELQRVLDKLYELDDLREFHDTYYDRGWWGVAIRRKDTPDRTLKYADHVAAYFARIYGMNDKWCNLTVQSETTRLNIEGAEKGLRNKTLIVDDPSGQIWDEAEALVSGSHDYQGVVTGDLNRKVKYDLRPVKSWIKQPSVTVRNNNIITHYEGRAVQVTEMPAMTVITLWKEIEYK